MQCRRCRSEMVAERIPGFQPRMICSEPGCPKGRFPRLGKSQQAPLDLSKEQARKKIRQLLAVAASTSFPGEAESARSLATDLAVKHGLGPVD